MCSNPEAVIKKNFFLEIICLGLFLLFFAFVFPYLFYVRFFVSCLFYLSDSLSTSCQFFQYFGGIYEGWCVVQFFLIYVISLRGCVGVGIV